jgi:hypothetical protein
VPSEPPDLVPHHYGPSALACRVAPAKRRKKQLAFQGPLESREPIGSAGPQGAERSRLCP